MLDSGFVSGSRLVFNTNEPDQCRPKLGYGVEARLARLPFSTFSSVTFYLFQMFEEHKTFWESFIKIYKKNKCLWEVGAKEYSNRYTRNAAYEELVDKCKELYPHADRNFVIKKINSLRASFRRQYRKLKDSYTSTGNATDDVREPTLWYYELMLFTLDHDEVLPSTSSLKSCSSSDGETQDTHEINHSPVISSQEPPSPHGSYDARAVISRKRRRMNTSTWSEKRNEHADAVSNFLQDGNYATGNDSRAFDKSVGLGRVSNFLQDGNDATENDCRAFGKSVGLELQLVRDCEQRDIAKKLISDALFLAKRGKLTCDARIEDGHLNNASQQENIPMQNYSKYPQAIPSQFGNVNPPNQHQQIAQPDYANATTTSSNNNFGSLLFNQLLSGIEQPCSSTNRENLRKVFVSSDNVTTNINEKN